MLIDQKRGAENPNRGTEEYSKRGADKIQKKTDV